MSQIDHSLTNDLEVGSPTAQPEHEEGDKDTNLFARTATRKELKQTALRGGSAVMGAEIVSQAIRFGSTMILARLLMPEDFGLLAMVIALTTFAERVKDLGLADATIQSKEITHAQLSSLFWINFGVCVGIAVLLSTLAKPIAWFYNEPRLVAISFVIASTFLFSGLIIQHQAILQRTLRFGVISLITLCSVSLSLILAIILAYYGFGYWALVAREWSRALVICVGTWLACPWRPTRPSRGTPIRHLLSFARNVTGANVAHFLSHSVDKILIGKLQGPYWVGLYTTASQSLALPVNQLRNPMITVGLPAWSALQTDPYAFRASFEKMTQLLTFFSMPIILFLTVFGDVVTVLLFGGRWLNAVPIFRVLAIGAFVEPLSQTTGLAMVACGRTREYFRLGTITAILLLCCLAAGSVWGVMGITAGYSLSSYLACVAYLAYGVKYTPVRTLPLLRRLAPNVLCSFVMALAIFAVRYAVGWNFPAPWLAVFAVASVAGYLGLWSAMPGGKRMMRDYWNYAKESIPKMTR